MKLSSKKLITVLLIVSYLALTNNLNAYQDDIFLASNVQIKNFKTIKNPKDIRALINKTNRLPANYVPENLVRPNVEARTYSAENALVRIELKKPLEDLYRAAKKASHTIFSVSGYRPYSLQKIIFDSEVKREGYDKAIKFVAFPGASEHQSGLTMDVSSPQLNGALEQSFGETEAGKWLAKNAHKYGFIIRYPKDKEHITKYSYEPWHLRYLGNDFAAYLYKENLCMEEYFDLPAKFSRPKLSLNGKTLNLESYNINGNNYFKLREIAKLLRNTDKKFDIDFIKEKNTIEIKLAQRYKSSNSESKKDGFHKKTSKSTHKITINKKPKKSKSYLIDSSNYFKLRDLADIVGFDVDWDNREKIVIINTR